MASFASVYFNILEKPELPNDHDSGSEYMIPESVGDSLSSRSISNSSLTPSDISDLSSSDGSDGSSDGSMSSDYEQLTLDSDRAIVMKEHDSWRCLNARTAKALDPDGRGLTLFVTAILVNLISPITSLNTNKATNGRGGVHKVRPHRIVKLRHAKTGKLVPKHRSQLLPESRLLSQASRPIKRKQNDVSDADLLPRQRVRRESKDIDAIDLRQSSTDSTTPETSPTGEQPPAIGLQLDFGFGSEIDFSGWTSSEPLAPNRQNQMNVNDATHEEIFSTDTVEAIPATTETPPTTVSETPPAATKADTADGIVPATEKMCKQATSDAVISSTHVVDPKSEYSELKAEVSSQCSFPLKQNGVNNGAFHHEHDDFELSFEDNFEPEVAGSTLQAQHSLTSGMTSHEPKCDLQCSLECSLDSQCSQNDLECSLEASTYSATDFDSSMISTANKNKKKGILNRLRGGIKRFKDILTPSRKQNEYDHLEGKESPPVIDEPFVRNNGNSASKRSLKGFFKRKRDDETQLINTEKGL